MRDDRRVLGRSGLLVSPLGLGLAALGRPGYINVGRDADLGADRTVAALERRAHAVLDAAFAAGIRYVDAARSYGRAEEFLASWLAMRGSAVASVTVGSKWGYSYTADWRADAETHEVKDHTLAAFTRQLAESRAILGSRLALYQIHSATRESGVLADDRVLDALAAARADGLRIGLSVSGPGQGETVWRALEIERDGVALFDTVQATWNLHERAAEPALDAAHAAGVGVIVKEVLANGRLTERGNGARAPVALLLDIAARFGVTPDAVAMAAALAQPWATVVLSGAVTTEQLASNVRARAIDLDADALAMLRPLRIDSASYWRERSALPWT